MGLEDKMSDLRTAAQQVVDEHEAGFVGLSLDKAVAALKAALAEQAQPVAWQMDVTLDQPACELLYAMVSPALPDDDNFSEVRLLIGQGHSGYGLYVASAEYPEEGSELLASLPVSTPPAPVVPHGWRLVPVEPTPAMCAGGFRVSEAEHDPAGVYRAMLAAAPEAPAPVVPQPLTDEEIDAYWKAVPNQALYEAVMVFARAIERAHGIGG